MKNFLILSILAISSLLISSEQSFAQVRSASTVSVAFASTNLTSSTWVPLISQTARQIKAISVSNSGGQSIFVGIANGGSTANTESSILVFPASVTGPLMMPLSVSGGTRISILSAGSTISSGVAQFNFFY